MSFPLLLRKTRGVKPSTGADQSRFCIENSLNHCQSITAGHKLKLPDAKRIHGVTNESQIIRSRRRSKRQRVSDQKISPGLSLNTVEGNARMKTDKAEMLPLGIQFKHSKITDEPHLARLKTCLFALLVSQQDTRGSAKLDCFDEALWRMTRQIQNEILVQVGNIGHAALSGQAK